MRDAGDNREIIPRRNSFTADLGFLMLSLGYARRINAVWHWGLGIGFGDDFWNFMLLGGRHYSEPHLYSYEEGDGFTEKELIDIVSGRVFLRFQPSKNWDFDFGPYNSLFLHFDSSDDDPGGGTCTGVLIGGMYGLRRFKVGARIIIGRFAGCSGAEEFGVKVSPLEGRVLFDW